MSTPRTDAAWAKTFEDDDDQCRAGNAATDMRDACAKIEHELTALTAEREQLRAEMARLRSDRDCEKRLRKDADELRENAIARAERYRLATLKLDAELAAEQARLDWVFRNCKVEADDFTTGNRDVYAIHDREDLGAAMKEDAK
jgi:hypothetical protein